jgi:hypothetical protein
MQIKSLEACQDGTYHAQVSLSQEEVNFFLEVGMTAVLGPDEDPDQLEFDFSGTMQ